MGLMDKLTAGIERVAEEADKAIDKGKAKVGEMQIELQMDGLAKKLGYLVFDFYRGREVDSALRQKMLDDLSHLEDKLFQARAEAAAKAQAATPAAEAAATAPAAEQPPAAAAPTDRAETVAEPTAEATAEPTAETTAAATASPAADDLPPAGV